MLEKCLQDNQDLLLILQYYFVECSITIISLDITPD